MAVRWGGFVLCLLIAAAPASAIDTEAIVQQNVRATVVILGTKSDTGASVQSSGCFVDPRGLILTTAHQVVGVEGLRAKYEDKSEHGVSVLEIDEDRELALLKSDAPPPKVARIGDWSALRSGAPLVSIATPKNLEFTVVDGIVSSTNRDLYDYPVLQTTLGASAGSSGGPVFDKHGELVGVIMGNLPDDKWIVLVNPVCNAYDLLRRHGVRLPDFARAGGVDAGTAIIPADDATTREIDAIDAYNRGVAVTSPIEKAECYTEAINDIPRFFEAWFNLAVACAGAGRPGDAVAAYERAAKLRPGAVEVQRNLGRVHLGQGRYEEALACFDEALRLTPDDPSSRNDLGNAYRRSEQLDLAEEHLLAAVELAPDYADAHYNLGLTYYAAGRASDAIERFERYLELVPGASDRGRVEEWIDELKGRKQ